MASIFRTLFRAVNVKLIVCGDCNDFRRFRQFRVGCGSCRIGFAMAPSLTVGFLLVDELHIDLVRDDAALVTFSKKSAHRFAATFTVIER